MKYKYNIKNLDCANCAKTIENKLNEDKNIKKAIVNFNSSTVTVETDLKDAFTYIKKIVSEIEPDAILSEDKIKEILIAYEDKYFKTKHGQGIAFTVPISSVIGKSIYEFLINMGGNI